MKTNSNKTKLGIMTAIFAATFVAAFIACFFMLFSLLKSERAQNQTALSEEISTSFSSFGEESFEQETSSEISSKTETSSKASSKVETSSKDSTSSAQTNGEYIDVGSGYIAEIISFQAETFDEKYTKKNADWSRPTNNYLPKGTVDYCNKDFVYDQGGEKRYVTLRCGKRVYFEYTDAKTKKTTRVVKRYEGKLPDHNELEVESLKIEGNHTILTLNTDWKAPFRFYLGPQEYTEPIYQDYTIETATFSYIDITFCYATVFKGNVKIPENHPIFESAKIIDEGKEHTLRLYLKQKGAFYGWDANYNEKGQLCFSFLNPANTAYAYNEYGRDLSGVTILIDAGHGGKDEGGLGNGLSELTEATVNLRLANLLAEELKKTGATVVMSRTSDSYLSHDDRQKLLKELSPDLCISIHHDANEKAKLSGFGAFYYAPFSKKANEHIYKRTMATGLYKNGTKNRLDWHYFFLGRTTTCPVVLTENGYMTNGKDMSIIKSVSAMQIKAKAIAQGTADYFASID